MIKVTKSRLAFHVERVQGKPSILLSIDKDAVGTTIISDEGVTALGTGEGNKGRDNCKQAKK